MPMLVVLVVLAMMASVLIFSALMNSVLIFLALMDSVPRDQLQYWGKDH